MKTPEKLASGRYKVRFRHGINPKTGKPRATSETFDTKREADDFAKVLDALGPQGALDWLYEGEQDKTIPTMDELAAEHIRHLTHVEEGTRVKYEGIWERAWSPHIGQVRAHRLTKDHLALAVGDLATRYSRKSMENQRGLLAGVVGRAIEHGHIPVHGNPVKNLKLPEGQPSRGKEDMRILSVDEFLKIEAACSPHYRTLLRFIWGTGCRWGEVVALRVGDLDLPNVRITRASKYTGSNAVKIAGPKTKKSRRTIAIPGELHDELRVLTKGRKRDDLVFTNQRGEMIQHATFYPTIWMKATASIGGTRPRLHDLRHSHASHLLAAGVPIHIVSARLGHESIKTTVDTYGHLLPDAQRMAQDAAALAFARPAVPVNEIEAAGP